MEWLLSVFKESLSLLSIPVKEPTPYYQCGLWSTVYPPDARTNITKESLRKLRDSKGDKGGLGAPRG